MQDRTRALELKRLIEMTPFAREEFEAAFEDCQEPIERARRTLIKSFFGHGSMAIFHKCGLRTARAGNQKSAAKDWQNYPKYIEAFIERLKEVIIENRDWRLIVRQFDSPRTLFYSDPPYVLSTLDTNKYYRHFLTDADHEAFAEIVKGLRGMVIISGYYSELYDGLFGEFRLESKKTTNNQGNTKTEFLWLSRNIEKNAPSLFEGIGYFGRGAIHI
jgi:DNA adenine methylase